MSRLPVVSGRDVVRALKALGYIVVRQRGSHIRMRHLTDSSRRATTVPDHKTVKSGTLHAILPDANLTVEQFHGLL